MRVTIQKYYKPVFDIDKSEYTDNFFGGHLHFNNQPGGLLVDTIVFDRNLKNAFPVYRAEYYYQDNILRYKGGVYDMVISTLLTERSMLGKTIYEFFNQGDPTETGREKYFILCEITDRKKPCGFIQVDTITVKERETLISFSITGIETEFMRTTEAVVVPWNDDIEWESDFLIYKLLNRINDNFSGYWVVFFESLLNINARTGKSICASGGIYNSMWTGGLNQGYYMWFGLKSLMMILGITFNLNFVGWYGNVPRFKMTIRWRSQPVNDVGVISKYIEYEKSMVISENETKWILVIWGKVLEIGTVEYYIGALFNKNYTAVTDANSPNPDPAWWDRRIAWNGIHYQIAKEPYPSPGYTDIKNIKPENVLVINPGWHAQQVLKWKGGGTGSLHGVYPAFARITGPCSQIIEEGLRTIFESTGLQEYKYLFNGIKAARRLTLNDEGLDITVGSKAVIDGKDFICEKISGYNNFTQEIDCEFREI